MQHFKIELIEHKRWCVPVEAENEAEAIAKIKREQKAEKAYLLGTNLEIVSCNQEEK